MPYLKIYFVAITFCFTTILCAQTTKKYSHNSLAEKIYLQLDNEVYTNNKTIWFKAIIANAVSHETTFSSGVLYVDLISFENDIIESKLIKINNGIGNGFFDLDRTYKQGLYQIRAYTEWNKNFNEDFLYTKYIKIFSEKEQIIAALIVENPILLDTTATQQKIKITLNPKAIDQNHTKDLQLILKFEDKIDSIELKEGINDKYSLDYTLPKSAGLIRLKLNTKNGLSYSTSFSTDPSHLDLHFFPEGGDLVNGISSKIGFKVTDANGYGKQVTGTIIDENELIVANFESNRLGMGSFEIDKLDRFKTYTAIIRDSGDKIIKRGVLPEIKKEGYTIKVGEHRDNLLVTVHSNTSLSTRIILKGISRGYEYFKKHAQLIDGRFIYVIPKILFPEGVIAFTVLSASEKPLLERLFFNRRADNRLNLSVLLDKQAYKQREKVRLDIQISRPSDTININTSILVLDKNNFGKIQDSRENLLSYFLLSSDLRGSITSPGAYFKKNSDLNIDDLMLTQGWRKYKYKRRLDKLNYVLENNLSVSGVVNISNSKSKKEEIDLMLMLFDEKPITYIKTVSAPGSFIFNLADIYGFEKNVLVKSLKAAEKRTEKIKIVLKQDKPLVINFDHRENSLKIESGLLAIAVEENQFQHQKKKKYFEEFNGMTELEEVVVDGYKLTPERKKVNDRFGRPKAVITSKEILKNKTKSSTGLYSDLRYSFQDKIIITRDSIGEFRAESGNGGKGHITFIFVDGTLIREHELPSVQYMDSENIASVELIDFPKNLRSLYIEFYGVARFGVLYGSVIAIYTKTGRGLYAAINDKKKFDVESIPVFAIEKEFYTPKHNKLNTIDWSNPDLRNPIYWEPDVTYDQKGKASVTFYNSDTIGDFLIILESVSSTGYLGYTEIDYTVKKREPED